MFGFLGTKQFANVGCFGKLPIYADFIRLRAGSKECGLFDKWLQEGMYFAKEGFKNNFRENYDRYLYYNFIYQPKNSDKSLIGIMVPGIGKAKRCFPFVLFISVEKQKLGKGLGTLLSYLQDVFFTEAFNIAKCGFVDRELKVFLKKFENWEIPLTFSKKYEEEYSSFISSETVGSFLDKLQKEESSLIFKNLLNIISPLSKKNISDFSLGIKIPISTNLERNKFEITFWNELILKASPSKEIFSNLFWSAGENNSAPSLFIYINDLLPKHFLSLLNTDFKLDSNVYALSEMSHKDAINTPARSGDAKCSEVTLDSFLKNINLSSV